MELHLPGQLGTRYAALPWAAHRRRPSLPSCTSGSTGPSTGLGFDASVSDGGGAGHGRSAAGGRTDKGLTPGDAYRKCGPHRIQGAADVHTETFHESEEREQLLVLRGLVFGVRFTGLHPRDDGASVHGRLHVFAQRWRMNACAPLHKNRCARSARRHAEKGSRNIAIEALTAGTATDGPSRTIFGRALPGEGYTLPSRNIRTSAPCERRADRVRFRPCHRVAVPPADCLPLYRLMS